MTDGTEVEADELVVEAVKRAEMLDLLRESPRDPGELAKILSASRSTIHRTSQTLRQAGVLEKRDGRLHLTGFGIVLTEKTRRFRSQATTARRLDEFLNVVADANVDIPLEYFTDADVLRPQPRQAHLCVGRIGDIIEGTDSLRIFSSIISPVYVDIAHREMLDGTDIEVVFDSSVVEIIASEYVDAAVEAFETGHFTVYVADTIPFELFIFDDGMAMAAHDQSGLPRMFVEAGAAGAVEWAEDRYRRMKEEAVEFDERQITRNVDSAVDTG